MRHILAMALLLGAVSVHAQTATTNCTRISPNSVNCTTQLSRQSNTVFPALQAQSGMNAFYDAQRNARANELVEIERRRVEIEAQSVRPAPHPVNADPALADKVIARMKICLDASAGNAEASRDCIARRYKSDPEFARGFDAMLSDSDDKKLAMELRVDLEKRLDKLAP